MCSSPPIHLETQKEMERAGHVIPELVQNQFEEGSTAWYLQECLLVLDDLRHKLHHKWQVCAPEEEMNGVT